MTLHPLPLSGLFFLPILTLLLSLRLCTHMFFGNTVFFASLNGPQLNVLSQSVPETIYFWALRLILDIPRLLESRQIHVLLYNMENTLRTLLPHGFRKVLYSGLSTLPLSPTSVLAPSLHLSNQLKSAQYMTFLPQQAMLSMMP